MSRAKDFIPGNDAEFDHWFRNLVEYVVLKTNNSPPDWDHIPQRYVNELVDAHDDWDNCYKPTLKPHTPAQTTVKNDSRQRAEKVVRPFVQRFLQWEPVTNDDRTNMALPNRDTIRTHHPAPSTVPEIAVDTSVIRRLRLRIRDYGATTWGKPDGVHGMELQWAILDARPGHVSEMPHTVTATANPIDLPFEEEERGKRVYFAARWVNSTEQGGPWSDIESAVIP